MDDKSELRRVLAQRRAVAFAAWPDAGTQLVAHFLDAISVTDQSVVAGYMPFRTEIDPRPLMRMLTARGATVAIPRISSAPSDLHFPLVGKGAGDGGTLLQALILQESAYPTTPHPNPSPRGGGALNVQDRAKSVRSEPTKYEQKLWALLRAKRPNQTHWRRQVAIGRFVFDFGCHGLKLLVEVDGGVHRLPEVQKRDERKAQTAFEHGYQLIRLKNEQVLAIETAQYFDRYAQSESPSPSWGRVGMGGAEACAPFEQRAGGDTPHPPTPSPRRGRREALHFHLCDLDTVSHFRANKWGFLEPVEGLPIARPNFLLVPLLGFDRQGNRIGYGKGFYDRVIADLGKTIITIGLAFAEQEVDAIPTQPHDQRLDWIITQNEAYRVPS